MTKSLEDLVNKKRQATADKKAGLKNTYKFKQPRTTIRILPTWRKDGDVQFYHDFGLSWIKDMDGNILATVGDSSITYGTPDPVRTLINKAMGEAKTDAQRAHFKEMQAKPAVLVNALILDDKECNPDVPEIVSFSESQFDNILDQAQLTKIGAKGIIDLENGFNLIVSKSGKGLATKYSFTFEREASVVDNSVMDNINDIDAYIRGKFAETENGVNALKSLMNGGETLAITSRASSYSGGSDTIEDMPMDAEWTAVDLETSGIADVVSEKKIISDEELENLFNS